MADEPEEKKSSRKSRKSSKSSKKSEKSGKRSPTQTNTQNATQSQTQNTQDDSKEEKSVKLLVSKMSASRTSAERVDTVKELIHHMASGIASLIIFMFFIIIAILEIVVGSFNVENCPISPMIPIWLIVSGGVSLLRWVIEISLTIKDKEGTLVGIRLCVELVFSAFWLIWLILGAIWTYSVGGSVSYETKGPQYCDHLTYMLAFLLITLTLIMIALSFVICCCICCAVAAAMPVKSYRSRRDEKKSVESEKTDRTDRTDRTDH